jgi:hypothetical protein
VGDLPFYVYAALKPGSVPQDVEESLVQAVEDAVDDPRGLVPRQMDRQAMALHDRIGALNPAYVRTIARQLMGRGQSETYAQAMVLGQSAINWGIADYAMAGEPETTAAALGSRSADELKKMLKRYFAPDRMILTTLVPRKKD